MSVVAVDPQHRSHYHRTGISRLDPGKRSISVSSSAPFDANCGAASSNLTTVSIPSGSSTGKPVLNRQAQRRRQLSCTTHGESRRVDRRGFATRAHLARKPREILSEQALLGRTLLFFVRFWRVEEPDRLTSEREFFGETPKLPSPAKEMIRRKLSLFTVLRGFERRVNE
jgi:hypothetical protein